MAEAQPLRFLDNDIVLKLCQYGIEDAFVGCCASEKSIRVLPTFKYRFKLSDDQKALKKVKTEEALKRLRSFIGRVSEADKLPDSNEYLTLFSSIDQIDVGEATLFALAALHDDSLTFTGDKKSIKAFACINDPKLLEVLAGKVKCLEQSIAEILLTSDANEIVRLIKEQPWEPVLRICFNGGSVDSIIEGLRSYYSDLVKDGNGILAPFPC